MTKRFFSNGNSPLALGAGVVMSGIQQGAAPATEPVQTWMAVLVLIAIVLPILMAFFGVFVLRVVGRIAQPPSQEDQVVYPEATLPPGVHLPAPTIWPAVLGLGLMLLMLALAMQSWIVLGTAVFVTVLGLMSWVVLEGRPFLPIWPLALALGLAGLILAVPLQSWLVLGVSGFVAVLGLFGGLVLKLVGLARA